MASCFSTPWGDRGEKLGEGDADNEAYEGESWVTRLNCEDLVFERSAAPLREGDLVGSGNVALRYSVLSMGGLSIKMCFFLLGEGE